ncbi:hypothetical protein T4D_1325 [Trichinella pseudospiralis]|uniref:Uncharacterized protein n=1 Tax=Trichinella pseudospiralis TaxID=6337 RepID=A0A0V1FJM2_TRIPS|nr:hypothetical protein T4D_1325 [Trichinella pseudospiralis]
MTTPNRTNVEKNLRFITIIIIVINIVGILFSNNSACYADDDRKTKFGNCAADHTQAQCNGSFN